MINFDEKFDPLQKIYFIPDRINCICLGDIDRIYYSKGKEVSIGLSDLENIFYNIPIENCFLNFLDAQDYIKKQFKE